MFNWSGSKGSFKVRSFHLISYCVMADGQGDIPFYGKTGLDFYTQRKVSTWRGMHMAKQRAWS